MLNVLTPGGVVVATNDDWGTAGNATQISAAAAQSGAFALAADSRDAAVLTAPGNGGFTAQVAAKGGATGNALIETYVQSLDATKAPLVNLSARTRAGTGDNVLIAGFVVGGTEPKRLLVRAVGPTLSSFGVTGALADPSSPSSAKAPRRRSGKTTTGNPPPRPRCRLHSRESARSPYPRVHATPRCSWSSRPAPTPRRSAA